MSSSAITTPTFQAKIGSIQNQADTSSIYSAGAWDFKNASAVTSVKIDASGNVGVGTTSLTAGYRMTVNGSISMPISEAPLSWTGNGIVEASSSLYLRSTGAANVLFQTNNTERMRIDASGNCIVTTTNANYITAGGTGGFVIQDANVGGRGLITLRASSGAFQGLQFSNLSGTQTGFAFLNSSTSQVGYVSDAGAWTFGPTGFTGTHSVFGTVFINRGTPGVGLSLTANAMPASAGTHAVRWSNVSGSISYDPSSRLLKTDIRDSIYGLNTVLALKPRQYKYIKEEKEDVGFIADEVINIIPEIVSIMPKNQITGISTDEGDEPSTVDYSRLTAVLVKALQELSAKVDAQAEEIKALKAQP